MKTISLMALILAIPHISPAEANQEISTMAMTNQSPSLEENINFDEEEAEDQFTPEDLAALEQFDYDMDVWLESTAALKNSKKSKILIQINKRTQRMTVLVNGIIKYKNWKISTGKPGKTETRSGIFTPFEMNKNYFSRAFRVILPYGIKFDGGNLIHATNKGVGKLGTKASHGCVRLHPENAKILFALVSRAGMKNTRVIVQ